MIFKIFFLHNELIKSVSWNSIFSSWSQKASRKIKPPLLWPCMNALSSFFDFFFVNFWELIFIVDIFWTSYTYSSVNLLGTRLSKKEIRENLKCGFSAVKDQFFQDQFENLMFLKWVTTIKLCWNAISGSLRPLIFTNVRIWG